MAENQANFWVDLEAQPPGPLHARLSGALRAAIRSGTLPAGSALPPSRLLAADLGCSRWTVVEVYQQLVAEGYATSRVGSGTRVAISPSVERARARPAPVPAPGGIDLAPGLPDLRAFPVEKWLGAMRRAAAALPYHRFGHPTPGGEPALRHTLADYLGRVRGADVDPEDLTVCAGVTDGVVRLCGALRAAGHDSVAVEDPGWTRLREAVAATGLRTVAVPVDDGGLRVAALERTGARVVVVSPAHQFPTGVVLAPQRRAALLAWARRVDGLIVEDDYDAEFRYDRRPVGAVQGTDPQRVALAGSLSKTLSPALGLGWLVTPRRWTGPMRALPRAGAPGVLDQLALAEFLRSGGYDRQLRAARKRYRARRDALIAALARDHRVTGAAAGLHLLLWPAGGGDAAAVVRRAARAGLRIVAARQYRVDNRALDAALVLGYGNLADHELPAAVARLTAALDAPGGAGGRDR
ncbi:GntR family transcriptional regulator [Virgisporangium aliadipatigenens]|uniref:GntR family transcriptional regulator n=1 Tax=Virgisporangium aliadipatigenens TaxID=741659 RepID=A0A8J3YKC1_9ACTN|nr:PLP-dependent aminotransferase family protein [Virgisporangium aliadipatigenens]GIJ46771.1 GntR family transcriptional regulator [Virgisporangium aliadipatigenens]